MKSTKNGAGYMDILVGLFLEFLIEGTAEIAKSKKTPKFLRLFALALIIGTMLLLFLLSFTARADKTMMWTFVVFGSLIAFFLLNLLHEFIKLKNTK